MILIDSSVWIDHFRGIANYQTETLAKLLVSEPVAIGDLILTEVLQGFISDNDFDTAHAALKSFTLVTLGGPDVAVQAAKNFRMLRGLGFTVRKTIDTVIATRCILNGYTLLHNDQDFDPFEKHLGLRCVPQGT